MQRRATKLDQGIGGRSSASVGVRSSATTSHPKRGGKINATHALYLLLCIISVCIVVLIGIILQTLNKTSVSNRNATNALNNGRPRRTSEEATAAMLKHPSKYVDEEKKLKRELEKLVVFQQQGKCLSVPVLTRWQGDAKPVWTCPEVGMSNLGPLPKEDNTKSEATTITTDKQSDSSQSQQQQSKTQGDPRTPKEQKSSSSQSRRKTLITATAADKLRCPPPTDIVDNGRGGQVLMKPAFGKHRSDVDAVFAFAQGYSLQNFIGFVETLENTGFDGDIVLSISTLATLPVGVEKYLRSKSNVVAYSVDWVCYKKSGIPTPVPTAESDCTIVGLYGTMEGQQPVDDPRIPRPLATIRFELYWAWALQYQPKSLLLLVDFRDTFFQRHPFTDVNRSTSSNDGLLYVFEENSSVPIGKSEFNAQWIRQGYGEKALDEIKDNTIICSGTTLGEQIAIIPYLQCMTQQFDITKCKRKGCDQGFHNYILYQKLMRHKIPGIEKVIAVPQGKGVINNLGIMRSSLLSELGLYNKDTQLVLNVDGTISPVVHQYDRDAELSDLMRSRLRKMTQEWITKMGQPS